MRKGLSLAAVGILIGIATIALAVPSNEILRVEFNQTFTGECCFSWAETVTLTEPAAVVPAVVTWSTDYRTDVRHEWGGLSVNGHPCAPKDPIDESAPSDGTFSSRTFQWVVLPSDGLIKGSNTFTVCGGGLSATDGVTLGFNTLSVRISK